MCADGALLGGGGGGLEDGCTGPGELVCGLRPGLELGTLGLATGTGGGGAPDFTGFCAFVGVELTGLGLGDRLGDEF